VNIDHVGSRDIINHVTIRLAVSRLL